MDRRRLMLPGPRYSERPMTVLTMSEAINTRPMIRHVRSLLKALRTSKVTETAKKGIAMMLKVDNRLPGQHFVIGETITHYAH